MGKVALHLLNNLGVSEGAAILHTSVVLCNGHVLHKAAWCQTPLWLGSLAAGFSCNALSGLLQQLQACLLQLCPRLHKLHAQVGILKPLACPESGRSSTQASCTHQ